MMHLPLIADILLGLAFNTFQLLLVCPKMTNIGPHAIVILTMQEKRPMTARHYE